MRCRSRWRRACSSISRARGIRARSAVQSELNRLLGDGDRIDSLVECAHRGRGGGGRRLRVVLVDHIRRSSTISSPPRCAAISTATSASTRSSSSADQRRGAVRGAGRPAARHARTGRDADSMGIIAVADPSANSSRARVLVDAQARRVVVQRDRDQQRNRSLRRSTASWLIFRPLPAMAGHRKRAQFPPNHRRRRRKARPGKSPHGAPLSRKALMSPTHLHGS